jgi:hypothetical protein
MKLTPLEALKAYCINCLGLKQFNTEAVKDCQGDTALNGACPFYPYRLGKRPPVSIFRKYCLYCTSGSREYVSECPAVTCPAYSYRMGKNPALIGKRKAPKEGTEALRKYRERRRDDLKKDQDSLFLEQGAITTSRKSVVNHERKRILLREGETESPHKGRWLANRKW